MDLLMQLTTKSANTVGITREKTQRSQRNHTLILNHNLNLNPDLTLRSTEGFSIIEVLAGLVILGVVVVLTIALYTNLFANPKALLRGEAFLMAEQEIEFVKLSGVSTDTLYVNDKGNLELLRTVEKMENGINKVDVVVSSVLKKTEVVRLEVFQKDGTN